MSDIDLHKALQLAVMH